LLASLLADGDREVRAIALGMLARGERLAAPVREALLARLADERDDTLRRAALDVCARSGDPAALLADAGRVDVPEAVVLLKRLVSEKNVFPWSLLAPLAQRDNRSIDRQLLVLAEDLSAPGALEWLVAMAVG